MDYVQTNILIQVAIFCVNKQIFFCNFILLFGRMWEFGYYSVYHFRKQLCL